MFISSSGVFFIIRLKTAVTHRKATKHLNLQHKKNPSVENGGIRI
jgi:hypothetical protein